MYVFKLYRGDVYICINQQFIRDVYLVFMFFGFEFINCYNYLNIFFKLLVFDIEKKKKRIIILSVFMVFIQIKIYYKYQLINLVCLNSFEYELFIKMIINYF